MQHIKPFPVDRADYPKLRARIMARVQIVQMLDLDKEARCERTRHVEGPCWVLPIGMWNDGKGYRKVRWGAKVALYAHRAMYEIDVGPIPEGLVLDHGCRVHRCCNPAHLEPVTVEVNTARGNGVNHQFSPTGRFTSKGPDIQSLPGTLSAEIDRLFEKGVL